MRELSSDEQRYLVAAFRMLPEEWFRPQSIGQGLSFSVQQSESLALSLAEAGLMTAQPDQHARLTELGRKEGARLRDVEKRATSFRRPVSINPQVAATAWLVALFGLVLLLFWLAGVL